MARSGTLPRAITALISVEAAMTITRQAAALGARRCRRRVPLRGSRPSGRVGEPPIRHPSPRTPLDTGRPDRAPDQALDTGAGRRILERGGDLGLDLESDMDSVGHGGLLVPEHM